MAIEDLVRFGMEIKPMGLNQYKFYPGLIERILSVHHTYGVDCRQPFHEIKRGILKDIQLERRVQQEFSGGLVQFAFISITSWFFIFFSSSILEQPFSLRLLIVMGGSQLSGVLIYFKLTGFLRRKAFKRPEEFLRSLYSFSLMLQAGSPIQQVVAESSIHSLLVSEADVWGHIGRRLELLLERWQSKGGAIDEGVKDLLEDVWEAYERGLGKFNKLLGVGKFLLLVTCFLTPYFLYLFSLFQHSLV